MQEHFVVLKLEGRIKVWVYAHLTLQEFMSAVWLSYQKWTQQCLITRYLVSSDELFVMFKMVIRFVCGILCDRSVTMQSILCKKLIPYTTQQMPMFYQLGYELQDKLRMGCSNRLLNLSNWKEFSPILFELISTIFESKPIPSKSTGVALLQKVVRPKTGPSGPAKKVVRLRPKLPKLVFRHTRPARAAGPCATCMLNYVKHILPEPFESKPVPSLLCYVKHILPDPLHFYFESVVSPNEWYTFLLSLPHLPHIQMIFIDVRYFSTEQFHSLISRIDQCSLNYLALTFVEKDTSTILSYTSIISSNMPANIKISITLDKCSDSDILFFPPANQFTGSLGIRLTNLSKECITNLICTFSSIQYLYYIPEYQPDLSVQELLTHSKPSEGMFLLMESLEKSFDMCPRIFSHLASLQEIHLYRRSLLSPTSSKYIE